jgi:putative endonuclease
MFLYILQSKRTGRHYVGVSDHLERRIEQHNNPRDNPSRWTRGGGPWKLVFVQEFSSAVEALRAEKYVKRMKSRAFIEKIIRGVYRIRINGDGKIFIAEKAAPSDTICGFQSRGLGTIPGRLTTPLTVPS